jgi:hypothetical protein
MTLGGLRQPGSSGPPYKIKRQDAYSCCFHLPFDDDRERKDKCGASADPRLDPNPAPVHLDDALRYGESQAGPAHPRAWHAVGGRCVSSAAVSKLGHTVSHSTIPRLGAGIPPLCPSAAHVGGHAPHLAPVSASVSPPIPTTASLPRYRGTQSAPAPFRRRADGRAECP